MSTQYRELIEKLAALEHEQWITWAATLMEKEPDISAARKERWRGLMVPYAQLSESSKEQDRKWARKIVKEVIAPQTQDFAEAMMQGLVKILRGEEP